MTRRTYIRAVGACLPSQCVTNEALAQRYNLETSDTWIRERTGIEQRYLASPTETTASLATKAAQDALEKAGISAQDIDFIIVATTTPDYTFPSVAALVQGELGASGMAFDVSAVCSGFVYALSVADSLMARSGLRRGLVIGAETMSRLMDWSDRTTCVLFGDGAGAVVVEATLEKEQGIETFDLQADGRLGSILHVDGGVSTTQTTGHLRMLGKEVFRHAVTNLTEICQRVIQKAGKTMEDIQWIIPHQANERIVQGVAQRLGIPVEKMISTVASHGNTSAASIPLAFQVAVEDGRLQRGDWVLLTAIGGGMTWGALLLQY